MWITTEKLHINIILSTFLYWKVIGHEITHGFDDQGRQNDKDGNAIPWWNNATLDAFKEKAQCVIDQYNNYRVPEIDEHMPDAHVNGINTQVTIAMMLMSAELIMEIAAWHLLYNASIHR